VNLDLIRDQITAAEKALAAAGGKTFMQINLRYAMAKPAPNAQWAAQALKEVGLNANDVLVFPHRLETYGGLLITTMPARDLPEPWVSIAYRTMTGDIDPHWSHEGLNERYAKWCAQKAPPTHCQ
jgi:hypothetical protein